MIVNRTHLRVLLLALVFGVGSTLTAVAPAQAATTRCVTVPTGAGGLDTFQACTIVGRNTVESSAILYPSRGRPAPRLAQIALTLTRNGQIVRQRLQCVGRDLQPGGRFACFTELAGNVAGPQRYVATASVFIPGDVLTPDYNVGVDSPDNIG